MANDFEHSMPRDPEWTIHRDLLWSLIGRLSVLQHSALITANGRECYQFDKRDIDGINEIEDKLLAMFGLKRAPR